MRLLDLTLPSATENLALDEALLIAAEDRGAGEVLRFWELPVPAVVVGAGGSVAIDVNVAACEAADVPILRRASGGGTVVLGPGCLCFSLVLAYERAPGLDQIPVSNRYVLERIADALRPVVPAGAMLGTSDLVRGPDQRVKYSGNAQQRKRRYFLHHGTVLCTLDLKLIGLYLNTPERQPDYRRNRPHEEFVMNLGISTDRAKAMIAAGWHPTGEYGPVPAEIIQRLVEEKYGREDWHRRR
jgi:lipoate-protein ligase A